MIQRIQTVYMLVALLLTAICLCNPVAIFEPVGMGGNAVMYNLWMNLADGTRVFTPWPLFAILLLTCPLCVFAIFSYKNRKLQAGLCLWCFLLDFIWIGVFSLLFYLKISDPDVNMGNIVFGTGLPFLAAVMFFLARRSIKKDDKLIRDMDRIR
ncbi:MAG: DUF4293 domain-containing protein [Prevotella sp.]|nr:DUF4293 domain-containing protein [Prevotella sp.]